VLIGWLNADDYYLPNAFNNIIDAFNRIEWADVYYGDYLMVGDTGKVIRNMKEIDFNKDVLKYYRCYIASTASFFKKKIFTDNNYLRKDFNLAMDYEFYLRLVKKSYQFYHLPIYLSCFRWHGGNKSLDKKQAIIEHNRILDLYGKRIFKNEKINRIIFIILYQYYRIIRTYYKIILRIKKNKME